MWSRLQRQVLLDYGQKLLLPLPNQGIGELRQAIAWHLGAFRGLEVNPEDIFVGAGTDFLYNLLVQLLGRDKCYGVEEPGYSKIYDIYRCAGARCTLLSMDKSGVLPDAATQVLHISPAHHFPTGLVTPLSRRRELLRWASAEDGRYIIEDDYDSEFRFAGRPLPTLKAMDTAGRVIYMNSFTKSLAPSIRISYMILPSSLMEALQTRLGFYAGTVPSFEQYTLARFIREGYFEKHINRMRKFYKARRDTLLELVAQCPRRAGAGGRGRPSLPSPGGHYPYRPGAGGCLRPKGPESPVPFPVLPGIAPGKLPGLPGHQLLRPPGRGLTYPCRSNENPVIGRFFYETSIGNLRGFL